MKNKWIFIFIYFLFIYKNITFLPIITKYMNTPKSAALKFWIISEPQGLSTIIGYGGLSPYSSKYLLSLLIIILIQPKNPSCLKVVFTIKFDIYYIKYNLKI
jgi:hypothetical protein